MGEGEVRYATSFDGARLAYQVSGAGGIDILELATAGPSLSIDSTDEQPAWRHYEDRLSRIGRLIRFDARGVGLSDPFGPATSITTELFMADALAVLDAAESERAVLVATTPGAWAAVPLAAARPDRVQALVLIHAVARMLADRDYPFGYSRQRADEFVSRSDPDAEPAGDLAVVAPSKAADDDFRRWWRRAGQRGASPTMARRRLEALAELDLRPLLASVSVPTLVLHRRDNGFIEFGHAQYLADHLSNCKLVALQGVDHVPWLGDADALLDEVEEFVTGTRTGAAAQRVLAAIVFTDIVNSTVLAADAGDAEWRRTLDDHDHVVARNATIFGGRVVKSTGDGALVTFDAPTQAIEYALAVRRGVAGLGLRVRAGIHVGEIEVRGSDVGGLAVHIAARVAALADGDEILVTRTVRDLTLGTRYAFGDRGAHELRGVSGSWEILRLEMSSPDDPSS